MLEHRNFLNMSDLVIMENPKDKCKKYMESLGNPKTVLYGGGKGGRAYIKLLQDFELDVDTIFDKYEQEKDYTTFKILNPKLDNVNDYELVIVTQNTHFVEMKEELERLAYKGNVKAIDCFIDELRACE